MAESAEEYAARQAAEYGTYVAVAPITYDGALAFGPGHPVPASNVEAHGYLESGQVRRVGDPVPELEREQAQPPQGQDIVIDPNQESGVASVDEPDQED